ncbi:hypothetical protein Misp01_30900 [Microtetraspora sp. NBRC 13810]|uniref:DoxX family protein n=1 Tax=Microtetraspora sp. NBRC 13810 TaxID=3030990 RepID=UPI0024A450C5|nr:DoxX family membrane protein [Microtetraspora sp. NBRC 13810]GLW07960.1 hypothetical protein Misp01_30900 [Microtetraspora sp. NBRC 13810]
MRQTLRDLAALAARIGVGGIFFANGWFKLEAGLNDTGDLFAQLGAPAPDVWAGVTMLGELIGGALLVAGLAVSVCGLLLFAEALAVFVVASGDPALPVTWGDVNLIVALGAAAILLAVVGAGRISVDHLVVIRRRAAEAEADFAADDDADRVISSLRDPTAAPETPPGSPGTARAEPTAPLRPPAEERRRPYDSAEPADAPVSAEPVDAPVSAAQDGKDAKDRKPSMRQDSPALPAEHGDILVAGHDLRDGDQSR